MAVNERGSTFIETIVSVAILGLAVSGIMSAFITLVDASSNSEDRSMAIAASQQVLEAMRLQDPEIDMPNSGSDPPQTITVGSRQFQAIVSYCLNSTYCTATSKHVTVDLYVDGVEIYDVETVFTKFE